MRLWDLGNVADFCVMTQKNKSLVSGLLVSTLGVACNLGVVQLESFCKPSLFPLEC